MYPVLLCKARALGYVRLETCESTFYFPIYVELMHSCRAVYRLSWKLVTKPSHFGPLMWPNEKASRRASGTTVMSSSSRLHCRNKKNLQKKSRKNRSFFPSLCQRRLGHTPRNGRNGRNGRPFFEDCRLKTHDFGWVLTGRCLVGQGCTWAAAWCMGPHASGVVSPRMGAAPGPTRCPAATLASWR